MARTTLRATAYTVIISAWTAHSVCAQMPALNYQSGYPAMNYPAASYPAASYPAANYPAMNSQPVAYPVANYPMTYAQPAGYPAASYPAANYAAMNAQPAAYPGAAVPELARVPANQGGLAGDVSGRIAPGRSGEPETLSKAEIDQRNNVEQTVHHELAGVPVHHPQPLPAPLYLPPNAPNIVQNGYPFLNAPLYPTPRPDVPYQIGATFITNQAFDPHEMLYAHTYRAMYPPYYYEVSGGWKTLPWGVFQAEHWRLRGTVVKVKYRSSFALTSGFCPPVLNAHLWHFGAD